MLLMQTTTQSIDQTTTELTVTLNETDLAPVKTEVLKELAKDVNLAGFRKGHAPLPIVEKNVDPALLQNRFLDEAVQRYYTEAAIKEALRPVAPPELNITKFVPFTTIEFTAKIETIGHITLPEYKKFRFKREAVAVTDKEVEAVIADLRHRSAEKAVVDRAAKDGDELTIDFKGVDAKTKEAIAGGAGNDFAIVIGSNTFIPGFEPELVGLKAGDEKTFDVTFPADYGAKELQKKKVTFTVNAKSVSEVTLPKLDDTFASTLGPKTVADLKKDIKAQLTNEKEVQAERKLESDILSELAEKAKMTVPKVLVEEEVERMLVEEKRNLLYRGQTWQEHLDEEGKTEKQHNDDLIPQAEARVKTGLVLGEVAQAESIDVSNEELDGRIADLRQQYTDPQMQAELDKPENKRDIASRLLTEKTILQLKEYAVK